MSVNRRHLAFGAVATLALPYASPQLSVASQTQRDDAFAGAIVFESRSSASTAIIDATVATLVVKGFVLAGDGGGGAYRRVSAPSGKWRSCFRSDDGSWWELIAPFGRVNVKQLGAKGDGVFDDTEVIQESINAYAVVHIPEGTWIVESIKVPSNRTIETDGSKTIVKQKPQSGQNRRLICIVGSNVEIKALTVIGNIAAEVGEQNHGVFVKAQAKTGAIQNVRLGDIEGRDIRGDVVYLGSDEGYRLSGVRIGRVVGENILRNVVSIVGGSDIRIEEISGSSIGFKTFDIEPEPYSEPVTNVWVGTVRGGHVGVNATSAAKYINNVEIETLDLNPSRITNSKPPYEHASTEDGLSLRNIVTMRVNHFKAADFARSAIWTVFGRGEMGCQRLDIGYADISASSIKDTKYNCYLQVRGIEHLNIASGVFDVPTKGKSLVWGATNVFISNFSTTLASGATLVAGASSLAVRNGTLSGAGTLAAQVTNVVMYGLKFIGATLIQNCSSIILENVVATSSENMFSGGSKLLKIRNSSLNGVFHSDTVQ